MPQDVPSRWTIPQTAPGPLLSGDPRDVGPYRIRGRIGSGGMGSVYLGVGPEGEQVAVKVIRGDQADDPEFRARFRREVQAAAGLRSRFFANLVDADPDAGLPWLATEYVPGPTLSRALTEQGTLPPDAVLTLVAGIAEALQAIHAAGLVHRDVKPSNVILGPDGPCLIDLGVVAVSDATRVTMTGQPVGTPLYMAPEQAAAGRTTSAADVWALGALAYRAATGHALFGGDHPAVVLYRVAAQEPSYEDCPDYLRPFLEACLVRDPERRPSVEEILRVSGLRQMADAAAGERTQPLGSPMVVPGISGPSASRPRTPGRGTPGQGAPNQGTPGRGIPSQGRPGEGTPGRGTPVRRAPGPRPVRLRAPGRGAPGHGAPRRGLSPRLVAVGAVAVVAVLGGTTFGLLELLGPDGDGGERPASGQTTGATRDPAKVSPAAAPSPDGSDDRPWAQGTTRRLGKASCWNVSVDDVRGRVATLTVSCDQAGTADYPAQTPSEWLAVYAVAADGTTRPSVPEAAPADTFWTQGHVTDPSSVTLTVTLPDVGATPAAVAVRHRYGYGWSWDASGATAP